MAEELVRDWTQLGVCFGSEPSGHTPDLERLLVRTVNACAENHRLLILSITWLTTYGHLIDLHRLQRLVEEKVVGEPQAILGFLLEDAVAQGADPGLQSVSASCRPLAQPLPLARIQRENEKLRNLASRTATKRPRRWGLWAPTIALKPEALRPASWVVAQNPSLFRPRD